VKAAKKILFLFIFFLIGNISVQAHPFYVSICKIDFNRDSQSLEISVKIFANDLLGAFENLGEKNIYLGEKKERPDTDKLIADYIKSKLKIKVEGKQTELAFVGKEMETDAVWSYFEIEHVSSLSEIEVTCNLLTEIFQGQNNIIQVNNGKEIKNMLLNKDKNSDTLTF